MVSSKKRIFISKKKRTVDNTLFLNARKMRNCRQDIKYSDDTIKNFIDNIAIPAMSNIKFHCNIYKGHLVLLLLNYCSTQCSERGYVDNYDITRGTILPNLYKFANTLAMFIINNRWVPSLQYNHAERVKFSRENFTTNEKHTTLILSENTTKSHKHSKEHRDSNVNFLSLRESNGKWCGNSVTYPLSIPPPLPCLKKIHKNDCIATLSPNIASSVKSNLLDKTRIYYPPSGTGSKISKIKRNIKKNSKSTRKATRKLYKHNPGILNKRINHFRTNKPAFHRDLITVAMEMENITENKQKHKDYMHQLYNGDVSFSDNVVAIPPVEVLKVATQLNMFEKTRRELLSK